MSHRWTFQKPPASAFEIQMNPNRGGSPSVKKNRTWAPVLAPGAEPVVFSGPPVAYETSASGTILEGAHFWSLFDWADQESEFLLTDDLGRVMRVVIEEFTAEREYSAIYPWKHTFTLRWKILAILDRGSY